MLASFVEDKVSIGSWIYLWAFYSVPSSYISVFVPVPYYRDTFFIPQMLIMYVFILSHLTTDTEVFVLPYYIL